MAARRSLVRRIAGLIVGAPVAAIVVLFALSNRGLVTLALWPFGWSATLPLFLVVLAALVAGFLAGGIVAWLSQRRLRAEIRRQAREAAALRHQAAELERAKAAAPAAESPASEAERRLLVAAGS